MRVQETDTYSQERPFNEESTPQYGATNLQQSKLTYSSGIYNHLTENQPDSFGLMGLIPGWPHLSSGQQTNKGFILLLCFIVCLISLFVIILPSLPQVIESLLISLKNQNAEEISSVFRLSSTFKTVYSLLIFSLIGYLILENKRDIKVKFRNLEKDKKPSIFAASLSGSYLANTCLFLTIIVYGLFFHFVPKQQERSIEIMMPFVDNPPQKKEPKQAPKDAKHSALQNAVNSGRHIKNMPVSPGLNQPKQQASPKTASSPSKAAPATRPSPFSTPKADSPPAKQQNTPAPPSPFRTPTPTPKASNQQNKPILPIFKPKAASNDKPLFTANDGGPAFPVPVNPNSVSGGGRSGSSSSSPQVAYAGSPGRGPVLPSSPGGFSHGSEIANVGPNNNPNGPVTVTARKDVDYGSYMQDLQRRIQNAWKPNNSIDKGDQVVVAFRIGKDGSLVAGSLHTIQSSNPEAEAAARQAVLDASPGFRPLPEGSPSEVTVNFTFTRTGTRFMGQKKY